MKFSKEADFKLLEEASNCIQEKLRSDESVPDLDEQFASSDTAHHRYFVNPYNVNAECWGPLFDVKSFVPLPSRVQDLISKQTTASFMGIMPEINRAWITVDNKIFFWNYQSPKEVDDYDGLSEVIVSVALATPAPGVFVDAVKYLIVVATTVEVVVLAVSWNESSDSMRIIPTAYTVPTDNVTMFKIAATQFGRIFMAGSDGNLYELKYDTEDNQWKEMMGLEGVRTHKCRKINHNAWTWHAVLLPPFIRTLVGGDESLLDICVDDARHLLYATTSRNCIRVAYLGTQSDTTSLLVSSFDLYREIRSFLTNSYRLASSAPRPECFSTPESASIAGVFVISVMESKRCHLLVVLHSGIRVYLRLMVNGMPYQPREMTLTEGSLQIAHIRGAPPVVAINSSRVNAAALNGNVPISAENGFEPVTQQQSENNIRIGSAFYSKGLLVSALENNGSTQPDELLGISEDLLARNLSAARTFASGQPPNLRECLSVISQPSGQSVVLGKVFDIKESCRYIHSVKAATLRSLYFCSRTPTISESNRSVTYSSSAQLQYSPLAMPHYSVPASNCSSLSPAGRPLVMGMTDADIFNASVLGELALQALPLTSRRNILCLTRFGMCFVNKNRPIDFLIQFLSAQDGAFESDAFSGKIQSFFWHYGLLQTCAMCLEVYCGLPDASSDETSSYSSVADKGTLRERSLRTLRKFGVEAPPRINVNAALPAPGTADRRLVFGMNSPAAFTFSPVHDALQLLAARFLRPVWLQLVLDSVYQDRLSPVWIISEGVVIAAVRKNLNSLMQFMEDYYPTAVRGDPRNKRAAVVSNALVAVPEDDELLTSRLARRQFGSAPSNGEDPERVRATQAMEREEESINCLWRVVSRAYQALAMIDSLFGFQSVHKVAINWATLKGVNFRTFVISHVVHEKIKAMVNDLVIKILQSPDNVFQVAAMNLTRTLTKDCFLYFSAGDIYGFEATRLVESIRRSQKDVVSGNIPARTSAEIEAQTDKLIYFLLKASDYWRSLAAVRNTLERSSELTSYCAMLAEVGDVGRIGIVRLCLAVAENFGAVHNPSEVSAVSSGFLLTNGSQKREAEWKLEMSSNWERLLYHSGSLLTEDEARLGREACFHCLLTHLQRLLDVSSQVGSVAALPTSATELSRIPVTGDLNNSIRIMVNESMTHSEDLHFRCMLFRLLYNAAPSELVRIDSRDVENYLLENDQTPGYELLYKYYEFHGLHAAAANQLYQLAHVERDEKDESGNVIGSKGTVFPVNFRLENRILLLQHAAISAQIASVEQESGGWNDRSLGLLSNGNSRQTVSYSEFLGEIQDELTIAGFQKEIFDLLQSEFHSIQQERSSQHTSSSSSSSSRGGQLVVPSGEHEKQLDSYKAILFKLEYSLWQISELFNEATLPFNLWSIAICLIGYSGLNAPEAARKLWRSVIFR